jgi:hypothetical protein
LLAPFKRVAPFLITPCFKLVRLRDGSVGKGLGDKGTYFIQDADL